MSDSLVAKWFCAAVAAGVAETCTMPFDVTKTRLQLHNELAGWRAAAVSGGGGGRGMISMMSLIARAEGMLRLFKGTAPAVLRQAIIGVSVEIVFFSKLFLPARTPRFFGKVFLTARTPRR